jgi:2-polyprenyl-3-methyl-5-hydroxy-6-metoxy-1,4-benzoquinol methylase
MDIQKFYNTFGWKKNKNNFEDAHLFEDLRFNSREYVSNCRKRLLKYIPKSGLNILDFASGPIQYKEYLAYSKNFKFRHCVDFSKDAIRIAKKKIGKKGKFYCNDFFKIKFKKNSFDCIVSLHTIYHIKKTQQKKAVEKLLSISKKNTPIIIIYSNPNTILSKIKNLFTNRKNIKKNIYFFCHPISWWYQFKDDAKIEFYPWRSFSSDHQKIIFPDNFISKFSFKILFFLEQKFDKFFINNFQYYTVVLKKK